MSDGDVGLSEIDSSEVAVLVMVDGGDDFVPEVDDGEIVVLVMVDDGIVVGL